MSENFLTEDKIDVPVTISFSSIYPEHTGIVTQLTSLCPSSIDMYNNGDYQHAIYALLNVVDMINQIGKTNGTIEKDHLIYFRALVTACCKAKKIDQALISMTTIMIQGFDNFRRLLSEDMRASYYITMEGLLRQNGNLSLADDFMSISDALATDPDADKRMKAERLVYEVYRKYINTDFQYPEENPISENSSPKPENPDSDGPSGMQ